jgi:hypothetical protein
MVDNEGRTVGREQSVRASSGSRNLKVGGCPREWMYATTWGGGSHVPTQWEWLIEEHIWFLSKAAVPWLQVHPDWSCRSLGSH